MIHNLTCNINRLIIIILFVLSIGGSSSDGQESISGIINRYARVTTINPGYVICNPAQIAEFASGDYVLLIQMQGVGIQTAQGSYGEFVQATFGTPGGYEFLIVQAVNYSTGRIDFTRNVYINSYDVEANVQLVQVPFYISAVVTGTIGSQAWSSSTGTGGVLAMIVGRKLTLNTDISVNGLGFAGANGTSGTGECVSANETANNHDSYPLTWNNAGLKGEGVAIHDYLKALLYPVHAKGQGRNFTGGGGGNGRFSGGGGGSNRGRGGDGGIEVTAECSNDPRDGGFGGMNIIASPVQNGIFAGGGGGASTQGAGSTASPGGNGGGIIIIIADTIDGNNNFIRSDGITASNSISNAGAGGGGAGGSVAAFFRTLESQVNISVAGGNGGTNPPYVEERRGGGGGGGLIWLSPSTMPALVASASISYGNPAPVNPLHGIGEIKFDFAPNLNGFLFNSIWSASTGNRIDSVCSNTLYGRITGTQPVGGTPPYTYLWQSSTTSATTGFTSAPGVNNLQYYTPPALLNQTTWFRRVVTDNGAAITDVSLPVMLEVHPFIRNNVVGDHDTLCSGQDPLLLGSRATLTGGNGIYGFSWESSTDNLSFSGTASSTENYQPSPGLTVTTWYRRVVNSGSCVNTSASVRLTVLEPVANNNILTPAQEICQGMIFSNLDGTVAPALSGGDNSYRFRWERSQDGITWSPGTGATNLAGYDPEEIAPEFPGQQYYRRVVTSGSGNVCISYSDPVLLHIYPLITSNSVLPVDQVICAGSAPSQLAGSVPLNGKGAGTYNYIWQDSTKFHSWTNIPGSSGTAFQNFAPQALDDTTAYRRIVTSSACTSTSHPVTVNVHKQVTGNVISLIAGNLTDTTICEGASPHRLIGAIPSGGTLIPGDYVYQWSSSTNNSTWADITISGNGQTYQPGSLDVTTWFRRRATSGLCISESIPVKVTVLPSIRDNTISGDQIVCRDDTPSTLTQASGSSISGGAGSGTYTFLWEENLNSTEWIPAAGINNATNGTYQPPAMTRRIKYRRMVTSGANGCCTSISNVLELVMDSLPDGTSINAGADTTIYTFDHIIQMTADPPFTGGAGKWTIVSGSGSLINESAFDTKVTGISLGLNSFLWTVTKGACSLEDIVDVTVYDLVVPEGFSPNDDPDGYNNTFIISGLDLPNQEADLVIINGAGTEVFSTTNRNGNEWHDWDGKNSKGADLPEGTYYYLLKLVSKGNGQVFKKSGFIVLKRY